MNVGLIIALLVILTFGFILAGIPVYVSLLFSGTLSLGALAVTTNTPIATLAVANSVFNGIGSLPLLAIPFFMLAGEIMNRGGITEKLIKFATLLIGRLPGILAHAGIVSSMFFGGITGSAQACASCMGGIMTPTEAGAISVVYALLVSLFVIKSLKPSEIWTILLRGVNSAAPLLLIIACAKVFSYGLTALQMPVIVNDLILSVINNKYMFLLLVNLLLLVMGMFMDGGASVIILAPILAPVASSMGISLIHFGIIMAFNLTIGNITPPLGYCLFITSKIVGIPVEKAIKGTVPYMIAEFICLLLITYVPFLVLAVPSFLGMAV